MKNGVYLLIMFLLLTLSAIAQDTLTVEKIIDNPGPLINENLRIEGTIQQYVEETSESMAYYLLKGDFGGIIMVKTNEEPDIGNRYKVEGTLYSENGRPFIHEDKRVCLDCNYILLYIIVGASAILFILLIILIVQSVKAKSKKRIAPVEKIPEPVVTDDYKTIILPKGDPKTMQFIPGRLEITVGEDMGKSFMLPGYPTAEGAIVSLGTKALVGERASAHIQIDKKFRTVSRMQTELIYKQEKLFVRNLSATNITQVDGIEIGNTETELKQGSILKTGELEFRYTK